MNLDASSQQAKRDSLRNVKVRVHLKRTTSSMECRSSRNRHYANQNVLPIVLYLTIPAINFRQNTTHGTVKHQKRKQRDFQRMKEFNEQKTVCATFPFYSLENEDFKSMVTLNKFSQNISKVDHMKMCNLQNENGQLKTEIAQLKGQLTSMNEKHVRQDSEFKDKLHKQEGEINSLKTELGKALSDLHHEQTLRKKTETEYSEFQEMTFRAVDKELEHYKHVNKLHSKEVHELKSEVKRLKKELSKAEVNATRKEDIHMATSKPPLIQTATQRQVDSNMTGTAAENNMTGPIIDCITQVKGCQKCGSKIYHLPRQCPARNFVCEKCKKRGHHTINCLQACSGCGAKKEICSKQLECCGTLLNCAYCNVRGHLLHVCLKKRFDELGY